MDKIKQNDITLSKEYELGTMMEEPSLRSAERNKNSEDKSDVFV